MGTHCSNTWENGEIQNTCWYSKQKEGEQGRKRQRAENEVYKKRISESNTMYLYGFQRITTQFNNNKY
jgi:hypothetical protein